MSLTVKLILEILVLWALYALYMAILVHGRGPLGGLFFYPQPVQERAFALKLITREACLRRKRFAFGLLAAWLTLVPMVMILFINGARGWWACSWQYYVLFLGAEFFDWLVIDTVWVALSDWWIIPGTEDLLDTWHSVKIKAWKMPKLALFTLPIAAIVGGLFCLIGRLIG